MWSKGPSDSVEGSIGNSAVGSTIVLAIDDMVDDVSVV